MDDLTKNIGFIVYPKLGIPSPPSSAMEIPKADIPDRYKMLGIKQPKVKHFGAVHSYVNKDHNKPLDEHKQKLTGFATSDKSPNSMLGNRGHETQHMVFSKIKATHGKNFGDKLVAHTLSILSPIDRKIIEHINPERNKYSEENRAEELLSNFHNYLQDSKHRDVVHKKLGLSPNGARTLHNKAKSVWKALRTHAATIDFQTIQKSEDLEKKVLDPNSGYKLEHKAIQFTNFYETDPAKRNYTVHQISVFTPAGEEVGRTSLEDRHNGLLPGDTFVKEEHRRKGIASAMYAHAERMANKKIIPSNSQTLDGRALWSGNTQHKQFGKNEDLQKRTPPVFPKLGVPDARRENESINDPNRLKAKKQFMAASGAIAATGGNLQNFNADDRNAVYRSNKKKAAIDNPNTVGATGPTGVGYTLSGVLRPSAWPHPSENESHGTKQHEEFHNQMGRIATLHGQSARRNLAENLWNALPKHQQNLINHIQDFWTGGSYEHKNPETATEEKIARLFNHLNSPSTRRDYHNAQEIKNHELPNGEIAEPGNYVIPGESRLWNKSDMDTALKDAHRNLLAAAEVADRSWLRPGHVKLGKSESIEHQLGHHNHLETLCVAARFLSGKQTDDKKLRDALRQSDGDLDIGVLIAHDLLPTKENIKALHSVTKIQDLNKAILSSDKYKVEAALPEAEHVTDKLQEAINLGHVQPVKLGGKHSEGTLLVQCEHESFLIKPESKVKSPAAGINEDPATQSEREVAFYKIAESVGLGHIIPHSELITLNGKQAAAMAKLPFDWRNLDSAKREDPNIARTALEPYRESGELFKWAILDAVLSNVDRHANNLMVSSQDDGYKIALIDHGSAFAGEGFNPTDTETFVPFYLRAWSNRKWSEMTDAEKLKVMPRAPAEKEKEVFHWLLGINQDKIAAIMQRYGINAQPHIAILNKLKNSKTAIDQTICQFWLGLLR